MFKKYEIPYHLDDPKASLAHKEIILKKPFLKRWYLDCYELFAKKTRAIKGGKYLELGSGGGFFKDVFPEVITSDIMDIPGMDMVFNAEEMPFKNEELASIMMVNVFHHIPNPHLFLKETERVLIKGGKVLMVEPANSWLGSFIYKRFHHEPFDEEGPREIKAGNPLSNSNQALPYIYFERDKALFEKNYPGLIIKTIKYHTPFIYLISGGVSRSAMLPAFMYNFMKGIEWLLQPFSKIIGLFCTIELEKV
jgi:SAM-dependent methyltransferase